MKIVTQGYALPIEKALLDIIENELNQNESQFDNYCILNFRDPSYSIKTGGYHPVEIMLSKQGIIQYITDFSYVGSGSMVELTKELDFDFASGILEQFGRCYPIEDAYELFPVFIQNFCSYYHSGVFEVSVSCE